MGGPNAASPAASPVDHEALGRPDQVRMWLREKDERYQQKMVETRPCLSLHPGLLLCPVFFPGFPPMGSPWSYSWEAVLSKYNCPKGPLDTSPKPYSFPTSTIVIASQWSTRTWKLCTSRKALTEHPSEACCQWTARFTQASPGARAWGPDPTLITLWTFTEPFTSAKLWPLAHVHASPHFILTAILRG